MAMAGAVKAAVSSNAKASQLGQLWDRNSKRPVGPVARDPPGEWNGGHPLEIPQKNGNAMATAMAIYGNLCQFSPELTGNLGDKPWDLGGSDFQTPDLMRVEVRLTQLYSANGSRTT